MKKNKNVIIITISIILFITSIGLGYFFTGNKLKSKELTEAKNPEEDVEILKEENKITPNTFIEKRIHYKECDHVITDLNIADNEIINMNRKEYEDYLGANYPNLQLLSYSTSKIVIWGEEDHLCKEHFIVGEEDGYLAIFEIGDNGQRILYKTFKNYPLSLFVPADQEKLKKGIVVDSEDELSDVLENFIS